MSAQTEPAADVVEILMAEDSRTQAEQLKYLLERHHYGVAVASDGQQALALLGEYRPALVISDIVMPGMDGYELCRRIKADQSTQDIPVILLTTLSNAEDVLEGLACGADNFITKPYSEEYLLSHIEQILASKKLYKNERVRVGVEILFAGKRRFITASQQQMLTLLISTYEAAVSRTTELVQARNELSALNERLEDLVEERTAALATERSLLRTLVDHLPISVYVKDVACRKTLANPADYHNMGAASEDEVLGKTDFDLFPPDLAALFYADDQSVIQSGQPILNREEQITQPDGTRGWQLTSKVPVRDGAGQVVGLVGIGHDITARKQAEQVLHLYTEQLEAMVEHRTSELREAQEQLVRQERLAVLGQLAGGVAHELRNPLGAIKNAVYFLNMALDTPTPDVGEALRIVNAEVERSTRIISSLLDFARTRAPARQLVNLNRVVRTVLDRIEIPATIELVSKLDTALPVILADAGQLEQVFDNLILNAVQATPDGGRLTVETSEVFREPPMSGGVSVSIADTGVGIPPENLDKVFEPLFSTKTTGIGLGLSLAKNLAEGHGGCIKVSSKVGKGSTFTVWLPIGPAQASADLAKQ